jgi:hypothetical protein
MRRFQAPQEDRQILAIPDWPSWPQQIRDGFPAQTSAATLFGRPLIEVRQKARVDILNFAKDYVQSLGEPIPASSTGPIIITGHQPELFHPGVWIKSFATHRVARMVGGTPIHVIIDNDTMKSSAIKLPAGGPKDFVVGHVPFDRWESEIPYEERRVVDESIFREFADRVRVTMSKLAFRPIVSTYWDEVLRSASRTKLVGERLAAGRRAIERAWGTSNLEVPISRLSDRDSFLYFWLDIAFRAAEFRELYNRLLADYRVKYKVRSQNHPATDLVMEQDRIELPFWVWSMESPARRSLWVSAGSTGTILWADSTKIGPIEPGQELDSIRNTLGRWKVRPKALMTTLYLRGVVGDWFLHGVGGGKYDEVTDHLLTEYLGWSRPPAMGILSGTLRLPGEDREDLASRIAQSRWLARDAYWNPDRHLNDQLREREPIANWIEEKQTLQESPIAKLHQWSRQDWVHFRQLNDQLRPYVQATRQQAEREALELADQQRSQRALLSRDYPFCLHPEESLRDFFQQVSN